MTQHRMDSLRSGYEVFARTGAWPGDGLLAADFELHQDPVVDAATVFHGQEAPGELLRTLEQAFRDISLEAESFTEAPDGEIVVVVRTQGRGRASGTAIDRRQAHVWTFADDGAIRMIIYGQPSEALKAVRLAE